jgi:hypothetical protein
MDMDIDVFKRAMPKQFRGKITDKVMNDINNAFKDEASKEMYRDNLISFTHVMKNGKFKMEQYISAVKYVGFKVMGNSNIEAYTKTFPDRYKKYLATGTSQKDIASYVTSYNKNMLVNLIYAQTLIPTHILNASVRQDAINKQASIMNNPEASFKVQSEAANSLLTHLKPPETKIELDVNIAADSTLKDLVATTEKLVAQQSLMLEKGLIDAKTVAHTPLLLTESEEGHYT